MSYYKQLYPPVRQCRSDTEIRNIFERHIKVLLDRKRSMINEIAEWENNLIRQIQENVRDQKVLLEQHCKYQITYLQTTCQEFLDTALIYEQKRNREEVRQLIEQCHSLKIQLGQFDYPERPIPFIKLQKEDKPIEFTNDISSANKFSNQSLINDDFRMDNNKNLNRNTSFIKNTAK